MATTPRPPRRPVVGSRNPTGRPRNVAGRRPETPETEVVEPVESVEPVGASEPPTPPPPPAPPEDDDRDAPPADAPPARSPLLTSMRTTVALVVALVVMSGILAAEAWYVWFKDPPVVSVARPVVTGEIAHRAAVEAASQSVSEILSYRYQEFDAEIEEATSMMTDSFAEEFRETAGDIKEEFVAKRTEQDVRVVAASVVQASSEQVRALLFLDQYVVRASEGTTVTPYRALVTMVHTDSGWLVSDIETK